MLEVGEINIPSSLPRPNVKVRPCPSILSTPSVSKTMYTAE